AGGQNRLGRCQGGGGRPDGAGGRDSAPQRNGAARRLRSIAGGSGQQGRPGVQGVLGQGGRQAEGRQRSGAQVPAIRQGQDQGGQGRHAREDGEHRGRHQPG